MSIFIAVILAFGGIALLILGIRMKKPEKKPSPKRAARSRPTPDEDEFTPVWTTRDYDTSAKNRATGFVLLQGHGNINVKGANAGQEASAKFIMDAPRSGALIELRREPENPHDANAVAVFGAIGPEADSVPLGYLPAETAQELAKDFSAEMPLMGELRKAGVHNTEDAVFININVLGPNAAGRKKFAID